MIHNISGHHVTKPQSGLICLSVFTIGNPLIPPFVKYNSFPTDTSICGGGVRKKGPVHGTNPILLAMGNGEACRGMSFPLRYNKSIVRDKQNIHTWIKVAARCSPRVNSIRYLYLFLDKNKEGASHHINTKVEKEEHDVRVHYNRQRASSVDRYPSGERIEWCDERGR
mmetsp:Transcript_15977/g.17258  ORF Transcript_15977/g.17258 Transcript_15977/m.17258 type:complete len:168 (-) Transcript_15977:708-1211(-)